jgi:Zn-dependent protease
MICTNCRRANLPGGVRCIYCGTPFPPVTDFDLGGGPGGAPPAAPTYAVAVRAPEDRPVREETSNDGAAAGARRAAGIVGTLGSLALLLFKFKSLLTLLSLGKVLLTFGTMLVSIAGWSLIYGWNLAVGFVISIFIHEMGHVVVNWRKGIPQTAPMFIPFFGALILIKRFPDDPTLEAESGAGGPVAGALAAFVCLGVAHMTGSPYWYALAFLGFAINWFNLTPLWQLDGAHMAAAFSPKVWSAVLIAMLLWALKVPSGFLWGIILIGFVVRLSHPDTGRYLLATPAARARVAAVYVLLAVSLGWGADHTMKVALPLLQRANETTASSSSPRDAATRQRADAVRRQEQRDIDRVEAALEAEEAAAAASRLALWRTVPYVIGGVLTVLGALLWLGTAALLARAAGRPLDAKDARLVGSMAVTFLGLWAALHFLSPSLTEGWTAVGAYFAAAGAAFVYAAYTAARSGGRGTVAPSSAFLGARSLAWAAAGALLVDWRSSSWFVLVPLGIVAAVYYLRHPWQLVAVAGGIAESLGDAERAARLLDRAAAGARDPESAADLWQRAAALYLKLDRGGSALDALDRRTALLADLPPVGPLTYAEAVNLRANALMLLGRWEEALSCCEEVLRVASEMGDPRTGPVLNFLVHARVARLAQLRGWDDEASAQAIWCLQHVAHGAKALRARLHALQAEALANLPTPGATEQARIAADAALKSSREVEIQGWTATALAQAALRDGDSDTARREVERVVRLLPGHLACRYWRGRTLAASGDGAGGAETLRALAQAFPDEHWGRRAQADLAALGAV